MRTEKSIVSMCLLTRESIKTVVKSSSLDNFHNTYATTVTHWRSALDAIQNIAAAVATFKRLPDYLHDVELSHRHYSPSVTFSCSRKDIVVAAVVTCILPEVEVKIFGNRLFAGISAILVKDILVKTTSV